MDAVVGVVVVDDDWWRWSWWRTWWKIGCVGVPRVSPTVVVRVLAGNVRFPPNASSDPHHPHHDDDAC